MGNRPADVDLLESFRAEFRGKAPRLEDVGGIKVVINPTPLRDITVDLLDCARVEFGLRLGGEGLVVYGKFDSEIPGGSVKTRPALWIMEDAILSGRLVRGQPVFETTSGNFGLALGAMTGLGLKVVALVSRKLQEGVLEQLGSSGVELVNLDIDICPAPGVQGDVNLAMAKGVAASVGQRLAELGFETAPFDSVRTEVEELLARQDAIGLAKLLARAYGGFCPSQYDNELNVGVHESVTSVEIDQQLKQLGTSLGDVELVCAFGTGGTAAGISRYVARTYGKKAVRVVFPLAGQDVAGIRTRERAVGLKFYEPQSYLGQHEADFEEARRVIGFFNRKGYDVGESGALALYSCIQIINYGAAKKMVVVIADGASKYLQAAAPERRKRDEVTLQEAASAIGEYGSVVWTHNMFVPKEEGLMLIAAALGCERGAIKVAKTKDVQEVLNGRASPAGLE
ncbi:MAG: pyridoxal-phosphate dependent enzyme [Thaumarchaeota archaeon]|nr:pyridoxal-phosphate dependent enzyme [Nitrososphaerota archaeon]